MQQLKINVAPEWADNMEEWLWHKGALSVSCPAADSPDQTMIALFDAVIEGDLEALFADFCQRETAPFFSAAWEELKATDWEQSFRDQFKSLKIADFEIVGEWADKKPTKDRIIVYPGQAFGTGQHETTQMALEAMRSVGCQGKRVLDCGCGTGILAIAAEKLGATSVFAYDNDPDCKENLQRHLRINRSEKIVAEIGQFDDFSEPWTDHRFDLILANITINVLSELWPRLAHTLRPSGVLITTGLLREQADEALPELAELGFLLSDRIERGEWTCLILSLG